MTIELDDRIHTLMNRLGDATPMAPTFESIIEVGDPYIGDVAPTRRRSWRMVPIAVVVSVIIPVLVVVAVRRGDGPASGTAGVKQVAVDSAGWTAVGALGPGTRDAENDPVVIYGTDRAPYGPIVVVGSRVSLWNLPNAADATQLTLSNGNRAVASSSADERVGVSVEVSPGKWTDIYAHHLDQPQLLELATAIRIDAKETVMLDGDATAEAGLHFLGGGDMADAPFVFGSASDVDSIPRGTSITIYRSPGMADDISITIYPITQFDQGVLGLLTNLTVGIDGIGETPIDFSDAGRAGLYRERDGLAFFAAGPPAHVEAMRQLLNSLAPVSERRWQQLVTQAKIDRQQQAPSDATLVSPATTRPPSPVATQRISLATTVETTAEGDYRLAVTTPSGRSQALIVRFRGRSMNVDTLDLPGEQQTTQLDVGSLDGRSMSSTGKDGWTFIVAAESLQHAAPLIGVVVNGTRYVAELQQLDPSYPINVGVILANTGAATTGSIPEGEFTDSNDSLVNR